MALVLVFCVPVLVSAEYKTKVDLQVLNTGKFGWFLVQFDFNRNDIVTLKEIIEQETGYKIEDQRLYHKGDRPITEEIKNFDQLKPEARYVIYMPKPLGSNGSISVVSGEKKMSLYVNGKDTLKSLKERIYRGRVFFRDFELTDDNKTLDYYQIGQGDTLKVVSLGNLLNEIRDD